MFTISGFEPRCRARRFRRCAGLRLTVCSVQALRLLGFGDVLGAYKTGVC